MQGGVARNVINNAFGLGGGRGVNSIGQVATLDGSQAVQFASHDDYSITGALTLLWFGTLTDYANYNMLITRSSGNGTSGNPFSLYVEQSAGSVTLVRSSSSYSIWTSASAAVPIGAPAVVVVTQGGELSNSIGTGLFVNDTPVTFSPLVLYGSGNAIGNADPLYVGKRADGLYHKGSTGLIVGWDRVLSRQEISYYSKNPWQIFDAPLDIGWPVSTAGGSTLNAAADGSSQATATANLAAEVALAAVGISTASAAAAVSASIPLSATGLSVSSGTANPTATVTISAAGLAQAAGQAGLSASVLLAAAGAAATSGNATLAAQLSALASGAAQASGSASLTGGAPGALAASGQAVASGTAVLSVTVNLQSAGSAQATGTATGNADAPGSISASGTAQATGTALPSVTATITAAGFIQAMGQGQLTIQVNLAALGAATASGSANLTQPGTGLTSDAKFMIIGAPRNFAITQRKTS